MRRKQLDAVAALIDVPCPRRADGAVHGHHGGFPALVKDRFVALWDDFAETVHPAHVMDAIHQETSLGIFGKPVPIIESRVTRWASFSSLQPSVPAGRIGTTRKRVS